MVCLLPVGILNLLSLFQWFVSLALKSPNGERSIKYTYIHTWYFPPAPPHQAQVFGARFVSAHSVSAVLSRFQWFGVNGVHEMNQLDFANRIIWWFCIRSKTTDITYSQYDQFTIRLANRVNLNELDKCTWHADVNSGSTFPYAC